MDKRVKEIFTKVKKGEKAYYRLNEWLEINIEDDQEASQFLVDVIKYWHKKRNLFCHDNTWVWVQDSEGENVMQTFPEDDWTFSYKTPSTCGGCVSGQKLLDKIFGHRDRFNELPYVKYAGGRNYHLRFDLLKAFIDDGKEKVEAIREEEARMEAEKEQREAEEARKWRLSKVLEQTSKEVPAAAHEFLADIASRDRTQILDLDVCDDVVIVLALRKHWSSASAIAHYSQLHVFADGVTASKEWRYRDQSANEDYQYKFDSLGMVVTYREDNELFVNTGLLTGDRYADLGHTFNLKIPEEGLREHPKLSEEELAELWQNVERERARMRKHLEELRERKPRMLASMPGTADGYQNYTQPKVGKVTVLDTGVAYFITEEQIDHRTNNRQMRYALYVMKTGDKEARRVTEDHAYENLRNAFVRVIDISPDEVTVETSEQTVTIAL